MAPITSITSPTTEAFRSAPGIIHPDATPYYWFHECINGKKTYSMLDENWETTILLGHFEKRCNDCNYRPSEETILCNENRQHIETIGGKNLLPRRFTAWWIRCGKCSSTQDNLLPENPGHHSLPNNNRFGFQLFPDATHECANCHHRHFQFLSVCSRCTFVNPFGEDFMLLYAAPATKTPVIISGGPLDRHRRECLRAPAPPPPVQKKRKSSETVEDEPVYRSKFHP